MKTKTDDYLKGILEKYDEKFEVKTSMIQSNKNWRFYSLADININAVIKDFISKEFKEYAKNLAEVSSV